MDNAEKITTKVLTIPAEAEITFTISGTFYQRLNKLIINYSDSVDVKEYLEALFKIKQEQSDSNDYTYNLETLIILMRDIELAFKNSGKAIEKEIEVEIPEELKSMRNSFKEMTKDLETPDTNN
jgi:heme oxygenase